METSKKIMDPNRYIGKKFGKCTIRSLIGKGGMAWVFLARHEELGVPRAIKVLKPATDAPNGPKKELLIKRFVREARIAASLDHKNIIKIHDVGSFEDAYYIEMEYLKGRTLRTVLADTGGGLPEAAAAAIMVLCADAINHAHQSVIAFEDREIHGVVHRDLKPENIFITESGGLKILDFGIAKVPDMPLTGMTEARHITGTLLYMSPEQIDAMSVFNTSDIFSLGTVFYEVLSGKNPFAAEQTMTIIKNLCTGTHPPVRRVRPGIHPLFGKIIKKCHKYHPDDRFQSAAEIRDTASEILASRGIFNADEVLREWTATGKTGGTGRADLSVQSRFRKVLVPALSIILLSVLALFLWQKNSSVSAVTPVSVEKTAPVEAVPPAAPQPLPKPPEPPPRPAARPKTRPRPVQAASTVAPAKDTVKEPAAPVDSLELALSFADPRASMAYLIGRLSPVLAAKALPKIPGKDQAYYFFKGYLSRDGGNLDMAAKFFERSLRVPTAFKTHRVYFIENALRFKALCYTRLYKSGRNDCLDMARKSWEGLLKVTKAPQRRLEAESGLKELSK